MGTFFFVVGWKKMTDETYDLAAQKAADIIVRADGVVGVAVEPIDNGLYGRAHYIDERQCAMYIDGLLLKECQAAALSILRRHPEVDAVLIDNLRIRLKRWNMLMVAVTAIRSHNINKSMVRIIDRVGRKWDRPDPDDTALGKELGKLERTDPAVAAAAAAYDQTRADIIDGKFG